MKLETKGNLQLLLSQGGGDRTETFCPSSSFSHYKTRTSRGELLPPTQVTAHVPQGAQGQGSTRGAADAGGPGLACKDVVRF